MKRQLAMLLIFLLALMCTSVGVVITKHESRKEFLALQRLQKERDELNIEWGQLQLEQSTWATHARVENTASTKLHMITPRPEDVQMVGYE